MAELIDGGVAVSTRGWRSLAGPMSARASAVLGGALGVLTAAFYSVAAGRSLDYDSSVTVGAFVKTPSLLDPLRRQVVYNNHPLFSLLERVVWAAGFHTEAQLRVLPIAFGALTVAVLTAWCARVWSAPAGLAAGAVLASNPLFSSLSREVRGYSLLTLCAVVSTLLLWRLLASPRATPALSAWYVGFVAAGLATHLYAGFVLVVHVVLVIARGQFDEGWAKRWGAALVLGGAVYLGIGSKMVSSQKRGTFQSTFPRQVLQGVLGQNWLAVALLGCLAVAALLLARERRAIAFALAGVVAGVAFVWIVVQPQFLVVRFLVWLVPGVALAAAALVARRPVVIGVVAVAVVAMIASEHANWSRTELPSAETAAVVDAARGAGMRVCGWASSGEAVLAYTREPTKVREWSQVSECDLMVGFYLTRAVDDRLRRTFAYSWTIAGEIPAHVYSRQSKANVTVHLLRRRDTLETHARTWPH